MASKSKKNDLYVEDDYEFQLESQVFGPCTYNQIDNRFNQYLDLASGRSKRAFLTPNNKGSPGRSNQHQGSTKHVGWGAITGTQDPRSDNSKNETDGKTSFKRATSKKATSASGWNTYDDKQMQLFKEYGISLAEMSKFESEKEKRSYIIQCMRNNIQEDLQEFAKKNALKNNQIKYYEKQFVKEKEKVERDKADIFKWLKIKTSFEPLKQKLRSKVVEAITDYGTQEKIEKTLDEFAKSRDTSMPNITQKIHIDNVPPVNTTEILVDVLGDVSSVFKINKHAHQRTQSAVTDARSMVSALPSTAMPNSTVISDVNSPQNITLPIKQPILTIEEEKQVESKLKEEYKWSTDKERVFHIHRINAKARMYNEVNSSNWNDVGFSPLVQASQMDQKTKLQRDTKLAKYMNGDPLTAEEYKYLAQTSRSLNAHIDKRFLQQAVSHLDTETISAIEVELAQNILHDYQAVRHKVRDARLEYLRERTKSTQALIEKQEAFHELKEKCEVGGHVQHIIEHRIKSFIHEFDEKQAEKKRKNDEAEAMKKAKTDLNFFMRKFLKPVEEKVQKRRIGQSQDFLRAVSHVQPQKREKFVDIAKSKHKFHPPSKLVLNPETHHRDFMGLAAGAPDHLIEQRHTDTLESLKLTIASPPNLRQPRLFRSYYTGGPGPEHERDIFEGFYSMEPVEYTPTPLENKVITKLQSLWRGFNTREIFKSQKGSLLDKVRLDYLKVKSESVFVRAALMLRDRAHLVEKTEEEKKRARKEELERKMRNPSVTFDTTPANRPSTAKPIMDEKPKLQSALKNTFDMILGGGPIKLPFAQKTPVAGTLQHLDESDSDARRTPSSVSIEKHNLQAKTNTRPKTATNKTSKKITFPTPVKKSPREKQYFMSPIARVPSRTSSPEKKESSSPNLKPSQKESLTRAEIEAERQKHINSHAAPTGLLLKQRKLFSGAKSGSLDLIRNAGFTYYENDANVKDDYGNTPLYYAAKHGYKEVAEFLLSLRARTNEPCSHGNSPLHMAFQSGNVLLIIEMIAAGGNLNTLNEYGQTPVAFGTDSVLNLLDLKKAVATYIGEGSRPSSSLPPEFDNNKFMRRPINVGDDDRGLVFKYQALKEPNTEVLDSPTVKSFIPPKEKGKVPTLSENIAN